MSLEQDNQMHHFHTAAKRVVASSPNKKSAFGFKAIPGKGAQGEVEGRNVAVVNFGCWYSCGGRN